MDPFHPDPTRSSHASWGRTEVDRTRSGKGRLGGFLVNCRLAQRDWFAIDHERARTRNERVITTMSIANDYLLRFERQDRTHTPRSSVFYNDAHLRRYWRVDGLFVSRSIEIDLIGKGSVAHL